MCCGGDVFNNLIGGSMVLATVESALNALEGYMFALRCGDKMVRSQHQVLVLKKAEELYRGGVLSSEDVSDIHHFMMVAKPGDRFTRSTPDGVLKFSVEKDVEGR